LELGFFPLVLGKGGWPVAGEQEQTQIRKCRNKAANCNGFNKAVKKQSWIAANGFFCDFFDGDASIGVLWQVAHGF
jgi:hypothetical protein